MVGTSGQKILQSTGEDLRKPSFKYLGDRSNSPDSRGEGTGADHMAFGVRKGLPHPVAPRQPVTGQDSLSYVDQRPSVRVRSIRWGDGVTVQIGVDGLGGHLAQFIG